MRSRDILLCLAAFIVGARTLQAQCAKRFPTLGVTDPGKTFIRKGFGEWGAARKDGEHRGVDILVRQSYPDKESYAVHAPGSGVVAYAQLNGTVDSGYGNVVVIDLGASCYVLLAHLAHEPMSLPGSATKLNVAVGESVTTGKVIGYMVRPEGVGSTGNARTIDIANQHQVHVAYIEAPSGRTGSGTLRDVIIQKDGKIVDPTADLLSSGFKVQRSAGDKSPP